MPVLPLMKQKRSGVAAAAADLTAIANRLDDCTDIDSMRGIEGRSCVCLLSLALTICSPVRRDTALRRSRRPPLNEVNAVLSLSIRCWHMTFDLRWKLWGWTLPPGICTPLRPGRLSFALDIMEELRAPLCDRLVISMFNRDQFQTQDFTTDFEAVYLSGKGGERFLNSGGQKARVHSAPVFEGESSHWDDPIRTVYAVCPCAARGSGSIPAVCVEVMTYDAGRNL